ncbi:LuxR family transcriptional regulator [Klebsiella pneumoniae]|uniref:LuxR family transcriptional regulator n=1 Tax=Klebsiella pneumoniae TaxID=573 RepID=A0A3S4KDD4_KLEPN|nr:LuxR family transcriptional regulator [Klebsiella pneumoniae]
MVWTPLESLTSCSQIRLLSMSICQISTGSDWFETLRKRLYKGSIIVTSNKYEYFIRDVLPVLEVMFCE